MAYLTNQVMEWNGKKVSDHNRSALNESVERIERKARMVDGTLRRYVVAKKRSWTCSWDNLPSKNGVANFAGTVDGGMSGEELESFHRLTDDKFLLVIRRGSALNKSVPTVAASALPYENADFYICYAMVTEFSKDVIKRGPGIDWWNLSVTIEEV